MALANADMRLSLVVDLKKSDINLLPTHKSLYAVSNNPSLGKAPNLNESVECFLNKVPTNTDALLLLPLLLSCLNFQQ